MIKISIAKLLFTIFLLSNYSLAESLLQGYIVDASQSNTNSEISFTSGKKDDKRFYKAKLSKIVNLKVSQAIDIALNYKLRCNNNFRDQRTLTPKSYTCPYPSKSIIETQILPSLRQDEKDEDELRRFIVQTRMQRRGNHSHVDLVRLKKVSDQEYLATQELLTDKEARNHISTPISKESVFIKARIEFTFKKVGKNKTEIKYTYISITDHWLLNKSIMTSRVFESMTSSITRVFETILAESQK